MVKAGIDLGESAIRLVTEEDGLVFDEASLVALDRKGNLLAIGQEAAQMKELKDPEIEVFAPFKGQTIDYGALDILLEELFDRHKVFRLFKKTVLVLSYPTWMKESDRDELKDHLLSLGAWRVYFDQEIWISAIGAGLDLSLPVSRAVLNLGEGSSDIAVFSNGKVQAKAVATGCGSAMRKLLSDWLRKDKGAYVSEEGLETIIRSVGAVLPRKDPATVEVEAVDVHTGRNRTLLVDGNEAAKALHPLVPAVASWVRSFLDSLEPSVQIIVKQRGIVACGGVFCLYGLAQALGDSLDCPVHVTDDPASTVGKGLAILISRLD